MTTVVAPPAAAAGRRGFRAAILCFDADDQLIRISDGLMVVNNGLIEALGDYNTEITGYPALVVTDWRGRTLAPGFIDTHVHYPQIDVIGSPADGLLPWLNDYTFPHESRFVDLGYAQSVATVFLDELVRHGVTSAMVYCSSHPQSVDALMTQAKARGLRLVAGKCLMDSHSPDGVRDQTEQSLIDSEALIQRWHGVDRLGYALTPRFAPSCSMAQMDGAAQLARQYDGVSDGVWVQTHVAENHDEIAWVKQLFPNERSYLAVYERFGLLRPKSVYGHCIYLDDNDRARMTACGASAAVCPTSNLFLGSGLFDFRASERAKLSWGLASDVGGGTSLSPFHTMLAAFQIARLAGVSLSPQQLWYRHTLAAARAIALDRQIGNLAVGLEADAVLLDDCATPLLARRTGAAQSLAQWLFALIVLGDDRVISERLIAGEPVQFK